MSTSIFIVTEVRQDGKWRVVDEVPESIKKSGYMTYAALAGVRDSFNTKIFEPKGLPEDISSKKVKFISSRDEITDMYNNSAECRIVVEDEDGNIEYLKSYDQRCKLKITHDEYRDFCKHEYDKSRYDTPCMHNYGEGPEYFIHDASLVGGRFDMIPYKKLYSSLQDFLDERYKREWDEDAQDYGHWYIDFSSPDYHTHSYLTLTELRVADYTAYDSHKYKMDKQFYNKFIASGGIFPDCFSVEDSMVGSIVDAYREALEPTITITWLKTEEEIQQLPLHKGINELKQIAEKYQVCDDDIRIIFAFD